MSEPSASINNRRGIRGARISLRSRPSRLFKQCWITGWTLLNRKVQGCTERGGGRCVCANLREIEKYCKTLQDWVLSPLKYAALPICLRALRGNLLNFDAPMWKYNYTISRGNPGLSHYIYLGSKLTCTHIPDHPYIHPASCWHPLWVLEVNRDEDHLSWESK